MKKYLVYRFPHPDIKTLFCDVEKLSGGYYSFYVYDSRCEDKAFCFALKCKYEKIPDFVKEVFEDGYVEPYLSAFLDKSNILTLGL